jgi:hypothetical protein
MVYLWALKKDDIRDDVGESWDLRKEVRTDSMRLGRGPLGSP